MSYLLTLYFAMGAAYLILLSDNMPAIKTWAHQYLHELHAIAFIACIVLVWPAVVFLDILWPQIPEP